MSINIQDLTFGVEIETIMPINSVIRGGHGRGCQVPWLPNGWLADNDPSLVSNEAGYFGVEFVSPVLQGDAGIFQLIAAVKEIKERGGKVNLSGGLHVHVGFDKRNREAIERLVSVVGNFEDAIYAQTGRPDRKGGRWCRSLKKHGNLRQALAQTQTTRYNVLNLQTGAKPTVEFRAFGATLDTAKILGHVLTCLGLCEKALSKPRKTKFVAKTPKETSPIHRGGVGQTALCRMFYFLGWTKGRESRIWGNLFPHEFGVKAIKKSLMGEAKTFDTAPTNVAVASQIQSCAAALLEDSQGMTFTAATQFSGRRRRLRITPPAFVVIPSRRPTPDATPNTPDAQTSAGTTPAAPTTIPRREPGDALLTMLRAVQPNQNETPS